MTLGKVIILSCPMAYIYFDCEALECFDEAHSPQKQNRTASFNMGKGIKVQRHI